MIAEIESLYRKFRRRFDRSEWAIRHLGLPVHEGTAEEPGLLLIQIDGLSRHELEHAIESGRMPFLRRLHRDNGYPLRTFYSGLPSTTPAVQAELYYGVRGGVPAFSFREKATGEVGYMFNPQRALRYEERFQAAGEPLLRGGSSWSNIYSGGAAPEETHFCISGLGMGSLLKRGHWLARLIFLLMELPAVIRVVGLVILELGIGLYDAIWGLLKGQCITLELGMILSRMCVGIGMREWLRVGGKIDLARGAPIVHLNFLGYDEMSHCRGPDSRFARWSLYGIDMTIRELYRAALASRRRDYQVWIFSDHGQERTRSFAYERHGGIKAMIGKCLAEFSETERQKELREAGSEVFSVAAMGPVGHVYLDFPLSVLKRSELATRLVADGVPAVLLLGEDGALVWVDALGTAIGEEILGRLDSYPRNLRNEMLQDLQRLVHNEDAGDLVLLGYSGQGELWTFAPETGSHGGIGPREVRGFLLTPPGTRFLHSEREFIRPAELRDSILHTLGRQRFSSHSQRARPETHLRIMTYNVHGCAGTEGRVSPRRIARIIQQQEPDIVALQELDHGRSRSRHEDQAATIAECLGYDFVFCPTVISGEERYGHAVLSRLPIEVVKIAELPMLRKSIWPERRAALWTCITIAGQEINVVTSHLGLSARERMSQVEAILGEEWIGPFLDKQPVLICGDFNCTPGSAVYRRMTHHFTDAATRGGGATFSSIKPLLRLDYVFLSPHFSAERVQVVKSHLTRLGSDHLPLVADLVLRT